MRREGEGILIGVRPHGETSCVVNIFTAEHGPIAGLMKGGRRKKADITVGNIVQYTHTSRLATQLGTMRFEVMFSPAIYVFDDMARLQTLRYQCELMNDLLPEDVAQPKFYDRTKDILKNLAQPEGHWQRLASWEVDILSAVGYGLALKPEEAVPCHENSPLYYVSPNTGRAVPKLMGKPYHDRMLLLPEFFGGEEGGMLDVFKLTGHFLGHALSEMAPYKNLSTRAQLLDMATEKDFT